MSVFSDINERKKYENRLAHLANHDSLTSLSNRGYFNDNLDKAIHTAKRNKYILGILFLDLNHFKEVNDTMGHESGDALLKEIAKRLKESVREEDTVARLGGDEFAIILQQLQNSQDTIKISKKIIESVSKPFKVDGKVIHPSTSIGISIYPQDATDGETLLKFADKAMYIAKQKEKNKYEFYDSMMK